MRIILLTTAAAILSGCASITPPLCEREDQLLFGTSDGCGFVRPDAGGDGFKMPARTVKAPEPAAPAPAPTDPQPVDPVAPPADPQPPVDPAPQPEPEKPIEPEKPADPEKPTEPPKDPKPKDNAGHGNGDEGDCKGKGCSDADNPGKGKK